MIFKGLRLMLSRDLFGMGLGNHYPDDIAMITPIVYSSISLHYCGTHISIRNGLDLLQQLSRQFFLSNQTQLQAIRPKE